MIKHLFLFSFILLGLGSINAQQENSFVSSIPIVVTNADLSTDVVLGELTINPTIAGKVIVTFNGQCIGDGEDKIIAAASNSTSWGSNEGHVLLSIHNNDQDNRSFSHTMVYNVEAGSNTFYAIGRLWSGTGLTSFYGALTVEFVPSDQLVVEISPVSVTNIEVTDNLDIDTLTINVPASGKIEVSFSGYCYSEIGTTIGLSASDVAGSLDDEYYQDVFTNGDVANNPFSQKLVYNVDAGEHTYYAVASLLNGTNGNISVYANLVAKFIPDDSEFNIEKVGISSEFNVAEITSVDSIQTTAVQDGIYVVNFCGECYSSEGDRIILAASNTHNWGSNNGNISVEAVTNDYNGNNFSHTMAYTVSPGDYTYYAVSQAFIETGGDQQIDLYATLSAVFYPNIITAVNNINDNVKLSLFPNPMQNQLNIAGIEGKATVSVFSIGGKLLLSSNIVNNQSVDVSSLTKGSYLITVSSNDIKFSQMMIKE